MITTPSYKGSVWTCQEHHDQITNLLAQGMTRAAQAMGRDVHPKKGNVCRECARLWTDTPPMNR